MPIFPPPRTIESELYAYFMMTLSLHELSRARLTCYFIAASNDDASTYKLMLSAKRSRRFRISQLYDRPALSCKFRRRDIFKRRLRVCRHFYYRFLP